jgi:hypothetical protein
MISNVNSQIRLSDFQDSTASGKVLDLGSKVHLVLPRRPVITEVYGMRRKYAYESIWMNELLKIYVG